MTDIPVPTSDDQVRAWLEDQLTPDLPFLLAFADDGVIWGCKVNGKLVTTHDVEPQAGAKLRGETLRLAHVFGSKQEIRLFRGEMDEWKTAKIFDGDTFIPESQILWGDRLGRKAAEGFARFEDLTKGIPPQLYPLEKEENASSDEARLDLRHTVAFNESGEARIIYSRLVGLRVSRKTEVMK